MSDDMSKRKVDYSDFDFSILSDEALIDLERNARQSGDTDFANAILKELRRRGVKPDEEKS